MKDSTRKQLSIWLYCGALAIFIQILLGGITRLTGSGLSITEWKPLLGALPPLNQAAWQQSFDQYKQIAQFKLVNSAFTLDDYKAIFFWEWFHRNWARFLGLIFLVPFFIFLLQGKLNSRLFIRLGILFLLGLLQGLIGWIMVKSGLNDTAVAVSDLRLAIHFTAALLLLCYTLWMAFSLSLQRLPMITAYKKQPVSGVVLVLVFLQLFYGGLMAGSKAALSAPTWPDMNGYLIPPALYQAGQDPQLVYLLSVQFVHRTLAILIMAVILILYKKTAHWSNSNLYHKVRLLPPLLVILQVVLGVVTLLGSFSPSHKVFALLHQFTGILLLAAVLLHFYLSRPEKQPLPQ